MNHLNVLMMLTMLAITASGLRANDERTAAIAAMKNETETVGELSAIENYAEKAQAEIANLKIPTPRVGQLNWQNAELVAMFHYDLHLFDPAGQPHQRYDQTKNRLRKFPDADFFAPSAIDVEQWIKAAVAMGATAAILTSCHENGLRLWQSDVAPFSLKNIAWSKKGGVKAGYDLVGEFVAACRKYNIKPGLFYCQRWNSLVRVHNFRVIDGECQFTQAQYSKLIEQEIEELCTRYGDLFMLWFDGGVITPAAGGPDLLPLVEKHQPNAIFYHSDQRRDLRWAGNEEGTTKYPTTSNADLSTRSTEKNAHNPTEFNVDGGDFCPVLADIPLRSRGKHEWFWEPDDESAILPASEMLARYEQSVGRNATLVIGLTPDNRGLLPAADVQWCQEFGELVKARYGEPLAIKKIPHADPTVITYAILSETNINDNRVDGAIIDRVVFGEDTQYGERVQSYILEAMVDGQWLPLATGQTIGHKRIEKFAPRKTSALRLRLTKSKGTPMINQFQVFAAAAMPLEATSAEPDNEK